MTCRPSLYVKCGRIGWGSCRLGAEGELRLPPQTEEALYSIVVEAPSNCLKHVAASEIAAGRCEARAGVEVGPWTDRLLLKGFSFGDLQKKMNRLLAATKPIGAAD